jgi:hypothetical protein
MTLSYVVFVVCMRASMDPDGTVAGLDHMQICDRRGRKKSAQPEAVLIHGWRKPHRFGLRLLCCGCGRRTQGSGQGRPDHDRPFPMGRQIDKERHRSGNKKRQGEMGKFPFQARPAPQRKLRQDYCPPFPSGRACLCLPCLRRRCCSAASPRQAETFFTARFPCRLFNTGIARGCDARGIV